MKIISEQQTMGLVSDSILDLDQVNKTLKTARPQFAPQTAPELAQINTASPQKKPLPCAGKWSECELPFRHFCATDVFDANTYQSICQQFSLILEATVAKREGPYKMRRAQGESDGLVLGLNEKLAEAFSPLFTPNWLGSLADLLDLKFLPRIEGALHSNPQGSRTGWIHTDCCSAWFDESDCPEHGLMFPPRGRCSYFTGELKAPDAKPKEYIRAATMIFYLCNDDWEPGDGGETGLYNEARQTPDTMVKLMPPKNNSLFLFECNSDSYHRFIKNPGRTRNSIILWLHSSVEDAEARWGTGINRRDER